MSESRPAIPRPLARAVKDEAGWRCAIPTCRQTAALELAHIEPWSKVREHTFDNLIVLCAVCHSRFDKGEIDRQSIYRYKDNLAVLNGRYSDIERRVLEALSAHPPGTRLELYGVDDLLLRYLVGDNLVVEVPPPPGQGGVVIMGVSAKRYYALTEAGFRFTSRWREGENVE